MKKRKIESKKRYVLAFLIGTFIFLMGFLITYSVSYFEYQRISSAQGAISYEIFSDKLKYSLFEEDICSYNSFKQISEHLGFQGRIIDDLERKFGKNDKRVLFRKRFYSLVELEHFDFINKLNKECNLNISTILFFYSNNEKDSKKSEDAGRLLDVIYGNNKNLVIYSFDINLNSNLIKKLKNKYNIEKSPAIIINGKYKISDFKNIKQIQKYINKEPDIILLN